MNEKFKIVNCPNCKAPLMIKEGEKGDIFLDEFETSQEITHWQRKGGMRG
jgi:ssDNA-binding Zn-finger/Zn-ribbon topoisomerase 1